MKRYEFFSSLIKTSQLFSSKSNITFFVMLPLQSLKGLKEMVEKIFKTKGNGCRTYSNGRKWLQKLFKLMGNNCKIYSNQWEIVVENYSNWWEIVVENIQIGGKWLQKLFSKMFAVAGKVHCIYPLPCNLHARSCLQFNICHESSKTEDLFFQTD